MQLECSCLIDPRATQTPCHLHNAIVAPTATHRAYSNTCSHRTHLTVAGIADQSRAPQSGLRHWTYWTYSTGAWHLLGIAHSPPATAFRQGTSRRGTTNNRKSAPQLAALHMLPLRFRSGEFRLLEIAWCTTIRWVIPVCYHKTFSQHCYI